MPGEGHCTLGSSGSAVFFFFIKNRINLKLFHSTRQKNIQNLIMGKNKLERSEAFLL